MQKAMASSPSASHNIQTAFASLVPATGERENRFMSKQIDYTDEPIGNLKFVTDFLPPPEQLVPKDHLKKVTITLSAESIVFSRQKPRNTSLPKNDSPTADQYVAHHQAISEQDALLQCYPSSGLAAPSLDGEGKDCSKFQAVVD